MEGEPFFSIIISTRDRPELFQVALKSVLDQTFPHREIVVVIDGSSQANLLRYQDLEQRYQGATFLKLKHRSNGHGQSYTMNYGADNASGRYLCFLDDDDYWTDEGYLEHVYNNITSSARPVQVHYSHQRAVDSSGVLQHGDLWLSDLIPRLDNQPRNGEESYLVDTDFLLTSSGFAHLNCSIFERDFFHAIGGMDESIRYENDRDVYIRSIDAASSILLSKRYVSLHNIPDAQAKTNMSTIASAVQKKLYQLRVYDKGIALCQRDSVIRFCSKGKVFELKHLTTMLAERKRYRSAAFYAREALYNNFNFRWLAYTLYLTPRAWMSRKAPLVEAPR